MGAYPLLNFIPVAALSGVMLVVVLHTFKWHSLKLIFAALLPASIAERLGIKSKVPRIEVFVIFIVTLLSNWPAGTNIAYAVGIGVAIESVAYAWSAGESFTVNTFEKAGAKTYEIDGPLYFVSSNRLLKILNADIDPENVQVSLGATIIMDYSAMSALQKISDEYEAKGKSIRFQSMDPAGQELLTKAKHLTGKVNYTTEQPVTIRWKSTTYRLGDAEERRPPAADVDAEVGLAAQPEATIPGPAPVPPALTPPVPAVLPAPPPPKEMRVPTQDTKKTNHDTKLQQKASTKLSL
eukprot:gnl/TRDRNA2_/TRDRNA2_76925_c3_seq1.p1 gnl/TRDRNA2_/TRDRNA2_76925_c3~~gnl/TRDRNA2_/TRDRNA2_76925_c3_seq1.p1  ORF type:complete len:321 (-),score=60.62 gnl/TRDRNA2_/TRDRNA2_76925_c3_seq1:509-1393(-)